MKNLLDTATSLSELFDTELHSAELIKQEDIDNFCDVFALEGDVKIYSTKLNYIIIDKFTYDMVKPLIKEENIVAEMKSNEDHFIVIIKKYSSKILMEYLK